MISTTVEIQLYRNSTTEFGNDKKIQHYILANSRATAKASSQRRVLAIHSFGIASMPYLIPKQPPTVNNLEQLHPPANMT